MLPALGLRAMLDALERMGYDGDALLALVGLPRAPLSDPDGFVPCSAHLMLVDAAARVRPQKNIALRLAEHTPLGAFPLVDYLVLSSPTLGEGLRRLARYYRLVGSPTPLELSENEDSIRVRIDCPIPFFAEYSVAMPLLDIARETGGARAAWASFVHRPEDPQDYERAFGCEVRVEQSWTGFALSRATWNHPMPRRDPVLLALLERHANATVAGLPATETLADRVRREQTAALADGDAGIEAVARRLALTPRTLQRRLAGGRTSFQQLLDTVRRELAEQHLSRSVLSIGEITFVLGYSEPAAFHRAFRRWHGTTPQAFRAARRRA